MVLSSSGRTGAAFQTAGRTTCTLPRALISTTRPCARMLSSSLKPMEFGLVRYDVSKHPLVKPVTNLIKDHFVSFSPQKLRCCASGARFQCSLGWALLPAEWLSGDLGSSVQRRPRRPATSDSAHDRWSACSGTSQLCSNMRRSRGHRDRSLMEPG